MNKKQIKCSTENAWPVAYRWLATGTLVLYTALGTKAIPAAHAQDIPGTVAGRSKPAQAGTLPVIRFDIPGGAMEEAAHAFEKAAGIEIRFEKENLRSLASPGVTGTLTIEQGLKQLVKGTGTSFSFRSQRIVAIDIESRTETVEVQARVAPSSPKYIGPLRDLPQTITVIPKAVIEEQGATSLRDVLRNITGLTIAAGEGGAPAGDNLTLRGFSARNDVFVDGVRDLGPQSRDPFNLDQVEVVKGPASAYTGRGSTGGAINLVSKTPGLAPTYGFGVNLGSDETKRLTADVNTPVSFLGERAALRVNAVAHHSSVAGRSHAESGRWGLAPSLALGLGTPTRVTLSYYKLEQDNVPDYGIPWVTATHNALAAYRDQPAPVERDSYYGLRSRDRERIGSDLGTLRVEHDFSDAVGLRTQLRYGRSSRDSVTTSPRFANNDSLTINRNSPSWLTKDGIWDSQTDFRATVQTGSVEHTVVAGAALTREANERQTRTYTGTPTTTLYDPDPEQRFTGAITMSPIVGDLAANSQSLYAFDTAKLHRKFELNGGLRFDRFDVDGVNTTGVEIRRVDRMLSLRGGAVYKPAENGSIYAAAGTSLNPSLEGLSYQPADATLEPEKTYTAEVGTKWDLFSERFSLSAALFRVEKTNARTPGVTPDDPPQVLQGEQGVQGVELGASGQLTRELRLFGAYTLMDSRIAESNVAGETGKRLINTPRHSVSIWSTYARGNWSAGGGLRFTGERFGNTINTRRTDAYWTVDAMASYRFNRHLDLRLNIYNLNDAYYFDRLGGGHLLPGAARSAMVSTIFRF